MTDKPITSQYNQLTIYGILFLLLFGPLVSQYIAVSFQDYGFGLIARLVVHIGLPLIITSWFLRKTFWQAFIEPVRTYNKALLRWSIKWGIGLGLLAIVLILGAYVLLQPLLDIEGIRTSLSDKYQVTSATYPLTALAIVLINPFLEEYFWRGFIYRSFSFLTTNKFLKNTFMILTGIFFALHHIIIVSSWFNWWQFTITVVFLGIVGALFNWLFEKSGSIIASWITHAIADLIIVAIGFHMFGFF